MAAALADWTLALQLLGKVLVEQQESWHESSYQNRSSAWTSWSPRPGSCAPRRFCRTSRFHVFQSSSLARHEWMNGWENELIRLSQVLEDAFVV